MLHLRQAGLNLLHGNARFESGWRTKRLLSITLLFNETELTHQNTAFCEIGISTITCHNVQVEPSDEKMTWKTDISLDPLFKTYS